MIRGSRIGQIIGIIIAVLFVGLGLFEAYRSDLLPIHQSIDVPPYFDNNADSQVVKMGVNTVAVAPDQLSALMKDSIKPIVKGQLPEVSMLFPINLIDNSQTKKTEIFKMEGMNWMTKDGEWESRTVGKTLVISNKGTEIIVPVEDAEVFQFHKNKNDYFLGCAIRFKGPDGNLFELTIQPNSDTGAAQPIMSQALEPTELLNQASYIGDENGIYASGSSLFYPELKSTKLQLGEAIIKTRIANAKVNLILSTLASNVSEFVNDNSGRGVFSNFDYITSVDNKLILLTQQN